MLKKTIGFLLRRRRMLIAPSIPTVASGSVASFVSASIQPVSVLANIAPVQAGSGDPSPDNIRPITGWTGLNLCQSGQNLSSLGTFSYPTDGTVATIATGLIPGTYTVSYHIDSVTTTGNGIRPRFQYTLDGETVYVFGTFATNGDSSFTCTIPTGATNIAVIAQHVPAVTAFSISDIMLNTGSDALAYTPYNHYSVIPVTWADAGTVYCGTLNVTQGLLTATHAYMTGMRFVGTWPVLRFEPSPAMASGSWYNDDMAMCNVLPKVNSNAYAGIRFGANNSSCYVYKLDTIDPSVTSRPTAQAWADNIGLAVTYPLAEPLTYQLTPQQVAALPGTNNVWADVGDVAVTYKRFAWQEVTP